MAAAAAGPCGVHMELGGKSAIIVFDDVEDMNSTIDWCVCAPPRAPRYCGGVFLRGKGAGLYCLLAIAPVWTLV